MKMKFKLLTLITLLTALAGCSGDSYEKYTGHWKQVDSEPARVLQISRNGETYLLNSNVFMKTDFFGNKKKPVVLKKSEGQLSIATGLGNGVLGLSEDGNTLYMANKEYIKLTVSEFESIKSEVERLK